MSVNMRVTSPAGAELIASPPRAAIRRETLSSPSRSPDAPEKLWVRIPDTAVAEWLRERQRLRRSGYPDRPPDVDTPTLRVWLARPGEEALRYFRESRGTASAVAGGFPAYTAVWHQGETLGAKVIVTGVQDGSFRSRVIIDGPNSERRVDKARLYGPKEDAEAVWQQVETIVAFIDRSHPLWEAGDPQVTDYADFVALEDELAAAEARAAGLLLDGRLH